MLLFGNETPRGSGIIQKKLFYQEEYVYVNLTIHVAMEENLLYFCTKNTKQGSIMFIAWDLYTRAVLQLANKNMLFKSICTYQIMKIRGFLRCKGSQLYNFPNPGNPSTPRKDRKVLLLPFFPSISLIL